MSFGSDAASYAGTGATIGSVIPGVGTAIGAAAGLGLAGVKYLIGNNQAQQSKNMKLVNPGYQMNNEVLDNARIEGDQYNDFQMPGYQQILSNLNKSYMTGQENADRGASSSGDVLDAANKLNYTHDQQLNNLAVQNAQGKQSALMRYLAAKAAAGAEYQDKNTYDRQQYEQQLGLKNQLANNGTANMYGAADQAGKLVAAMFSYGGKGTTGGTGDVVKGAPIIDTPVQSTTNTTA